jgi:PAS domain S-box-containing protein
MIQTPPAPTGGSYSPISPAAVSYAFGNLVAACTINVGGRIASVSDRWCELTSRRREEMVGKHWKDLVPLEDLDPSVQIARMATEHVQPFEYELGIPDRSGPNHRFVQCQVSPLLQDGVLRGWLAVMADVTAHKESEEALRQSERRLQVIFDNSTDIVTILEPDGGWRSTSRGGNLLLGYPETQPPPEAAWSTIHPDDRQTVTAALNEIRNGRTQGAGQRWEYRAIRADGRVIWLETVGVNLIYDPAVHGIVLHSRDVTERHEAADKLGTMVSRLASLVDNLLVGVILYDEHGSVLFSNKTFADLFGLLTGPAALAGWHRRAVRNQLMSHAFSDPEGTDRRVEEITRIGQTVIGERVLLSDGRTLARSYVPISADGQSRGELWLFEDLTERMAMEAEREYLLEIEREQNARLVELDGLKSELVASVSHELRTPLTSIVSFTQLLRDGLVSDSHEDQEEFLDIIRRNSQRLLVLVDDLLLLDRLESKSLQLRLEPVDLGWLVEMAVRSIQPIANEKGVMVDFSSATGHKLIGDVDRLGQLVDNLLSNAVKFTPAGGEVHIDAFPDGGGWKLTISDTGIGIPANEIRELFNRFYRASNARDSAMSGTGLGLAIAMRIAEIHGGGIVVSSKVDKGTTFTVTLTDASQMMLPGSPLTAGTS